MFAIAPIPGRHPGEKGCKGVRFRGQSNLPEDLVARKTSPYKQLEGRALFGTCVPTAGVCQARLLSQHWQIRKERKKRIICLQSFSDSTAASGALEP
jgi:hypothetical protein